MGLQVPSPTTLAISRDTRQEGESSQTAKDRVFALMTRKTEIQAEMDSHFSILRLNSSTMNTPLLDPDGFPRADIDVYNVRLSRVRIIELRNDLAACMEEIRQSLEGCWDVKDTPAGRDVSEETSDAAHEVRFGEPFARVDGVMPGSPAHDAGLLRDDLIIAFGSLSSLVRSMTSLAPIAEVTQAHRDNEMGVVVLRGHDRKHLTLRPRLGWGGRGLLGCHIVPYHA